MMTRPTLFAAACSILFATPALAQSAATAPASSEEAPSTASGTPEAVSSPDPMPDAHEHHGFFLRGYLGGGARSMSATSNGTSVSVSGAGVSVGFIGGGAVAEDLIVSGELMFENAQNPTIEEGSRSIDTKDASFTFIGLGPGIAYYFMPANVHVGASLLLTEATLDYQGQKIAETDWGFGGVARVGKDFWVGKGFAIGVLGQLSVASMKDKASQSGTAPTWTAVAGSIAFSGSLH